MSRYLIDEYPLIVLPTLARVLGLNEAIFLQQLNYWLVGSRHNHDGRKWVYNTFEDWQKQMPFFTVVTLKRIVKTLRESGVIITTSKYNKLSMDRTLWYSIDGEKLDSIISDYAKYQNDTMPVSDVPPSDQNDPSIVSKRSDAECQIDTSNNQILPEDTTDTSAAQQHAKTTEPPPVAAPTEQQQMFAKMCSIVGWDHTALDERSRGEVATALKALKKADPPYTLADLNDFGPKVWAQDWRWIKNKQRPTLTQLRQEIGKLRAQDFGANGAVSPSTWAQAFAHQEVPDYIRKMQEAA
jgi:hypothetical protein